MNKNNGFISFEDLKAMNQFIELLYGTYRGYTIISMGPPS